MSKIIGQNKLVSEIQNIIDILNVSEVGIRPHFILIGERGVLNR
jgi:hypothetical protein